MHDLKIPDQSAAVAISRKFSDRLTVRDSCSLKKQRQLSTEASTDKHAALRRPMKVAHPNLFTCPSLFSNAAYDRLYTRCDPKGARSQYLFYDTPL